VKLADGPVEATIQLLKENGGGIVNQAEGLSDDPTQSCYRRANLQQRLRLPELFRKPDEVDLS